MIYDKFPERARSIGGIDKIGVVSAENETAVIFAGGKTLKKYLDGTKQAAVKLQITAMDKSSDHKELVKRMCSILSSLTKGNWIFEGIMQPKCKITSPPLPTAHNQAGWIYAATIEITFYTKEDI